MPEDTDNDTEWADGVDYRLLILEKQGKTLKMGVMVAIGAGTAGVGMSLILGKTVAKIADQLGQLGQLTQAMMVQLNGPTQGAPPMPGSSTGATPTGQDVPVPSGEGAVRSFLAPRGTLPDESIRGGDESLEPVLGPESQVSEEDRAALENERINLNGAPPDAGTAVILDDEDIKPVGQG